MSGCNKWPGSVFVSLKLNVRISVQIWIHLRSKIIIEIIISGNDLILHRFLFVDINYLLSVILYKNYKCCYPFEVFDVKVI